MMTIARKLCLLGDFSVGKTSLIRRYIHDDFSLDYQATVGVQIHRYEDDIETDDGIVSCTQIIWDVEGSRFGRELVTNYIMGSSGALIVGDATRDDAIPSMENHARTFLAVLPGRPIVFALNKCDLLPDGTRRDSTILTGAFGCDVAHTSARTGDGVRSLFHALGRRMLQTGA